MKGKKLLVALLLVMAVGCTEQSAQRTSNSLLIIEPYKHAGTWVFDDPGRGLKKEPFVAGIPGIIDKVTEDIPDAEDGFRIIFSAQPFPGHTHTLVRKEKQGGGNWYRCPKYDMEGWLCPALYKYFDEAPEVIYFKVGET